MSATLPSAQAVRAPAHPDAPDQELAARAAAGDTSAFEVLYDRHAGRVLTLCERVLGSSHDAADATQETFLRFLRRLPSLDVRHDSVAPYLFTCARHVCFDLLGKGSRVDAVDEVPEAAGPPVGGREAAPATEDPERSTLIGDARAGVREACMRLNPRHREVLYLREVEELSYEDIAEVLELNANAVAQLLSRARLRLRDELRGSALASFAGDLPECGRATDLLSAGVDGRPLDDADRAWLASHLGDCDRCRMAGEALAEAGRSYRMLAPAAVAFEVLRRETLARAAEPLAELRAAAEGAADAEDGTTGRSGIAGRGLPGRRAKAGAVLAALAALALVLPAAVSDPRLEQVVPAAVEGPLAEPASAAEPAGTTPRRDAGGDDPAQPVAGDPDAPVSSPASGAAPSTAAPATRRRSRAGGGIAPSSGGSVGTPDVTPAPPAQTAPPVVVPTPPAADPPAPPADTTPEPPTGEPEPDRPTKPPSRPRPPTGGTGTIAPPSPNPPPG